MDVWGLLAALPRGATVNFNVVAADRPGGTAFDTSAKSIWFFGAQP